MDDPGIRRQNAPDVAPTERARSWQLCLAGAKHPDNRRALYATYEMCSVRFPLRPDSPYWRRSGSCSVGAAWRAANVPTTRLWLRSAERRPFELGPAVRLHRRSARRESASR